MMHGHLRAVVTGAFALGAAACASTATREWLAPQASAGVAASAAGAGLVLVPRSDADGGALPAVAAEAASSPPTPAPTPTCAQKLAQIDPDAPKPAGRFADRRADEALDRLATYVTIGEERRGRVITLRSDDLGEPGEWALDQQGSHRIEELVDALRQQGGRLIVVSGYTDSRGSQALNDSLSLLRAQAVFLVSSALRRHAWLPIVLAIAVFTLSAWMDCSAPADVDADSRHERVGLASAVSPRVGGY